MGDDVVVGKQTLFSQPLVRFERDGDVWKTDAGDVFLPVIVRELLARSGQSPWLVDSEDWVQVPAWVTVSYPSQKK